MIKNRSRNAIEYSNNTNNDSDNLNNSESFQEEDDNDDEFFNELNKDKRANKEKRSHRNIGSITSMILENNDGKIVSSTNKKKIKADIKAQREENDLSVKKKLKKKQRKLGYLLPINNNWNENYEKLNLKKTTVKGVVKLMNSIMEMKRSAVEEKNKENENKEKKSRNFLAMHNLKAPTENKQPVSKSNKKYEEDE